MDSRRSCVLLHFLSTNMYCIDITRLHQLEVRWERRWLNLLIRNDIRDKVNLQYFPLPHRPMLSFVWKDDTVTNGRPILLKNQSYTSRTWSYVANAVFSSRSKEYMSFIRNSLPLNNPARGRFSSRNFRATVTCIQPFHTYLIHSQWKSSPALNISCN